MSMRIVLIGVALAASACLPNFTKTGRYPGADGGRELPAGVSAREAPTQMGEKVVSDKVEPNTLIAADRMSCTVSEAKWRETVIGEKAFCAWKKT